MKRIRITNSSDPYFDAAWALYQKSFPLYEQRRLPEQEAVFGEESYHFEALTQGGRFAGIMLYWENARFIYLEHLAICSELRGGGLGTKALDLLMGAGKRVILEVDPIVDDISASRLNFYRRVGFAENPFLHIHPPYRQQFSGHKLLLLSWPGQLSNDTYNAFAFYLTNKVMAYAE